MKQLVSRKVIAEKDFKQIQQIYKTDKKVLYSVKRNKSSYIFVIVADDIETVRKLTQDLANVSKAFVGKFNQ